MAIKTLGKTKVTTKTIGTTKIEVNFSLDRETKGALKFSEVDDKGTALTGDDSVIGGLYLRKAALDGAVPKSVKITVEY